MYLLCGCISDPFIFLLKFILLLAKEKKKKRFKNMRKKRKILTRNVENFKARKWQKFLNDRKN